MFGAVACQIVAALAVQIRLSLGRVAPAGWAANVAELRVMRDVAALLSGLALLRHLVCRVSTRGAA